MRRRKHWYACTCGVCDLKRCVDVAAERDSAAEQMVAYADRRLGIVEWRLFMMVPTLPSGKHSQPDPFEWPKTWSAA